MLGGYSKFLLDVGEDKIQKKQNDEIDMVMPERTMEEDIDFICPIFENPAEPFSKNCIDTIMRKIHSPSIRHFPGMMK